MALMVNRYEDINCVAGGGDLMKFEDYIQHCSKWVWWYLEVWCFEDWDEDWAKKGLTKYRPLFYSRAEQIAREGAAFKNFNGIGSSQMVELYQMVMMAGVGMRMAARMFKAKEKDVAAFHLETLFRRGLLAFLIDKLDLYITLNWWALLSMYAPVTRELKRRGDEHIGFPVGLYKLLSMIDRWSGSPGILDEAILRRIDECVKKARIPPVVFETLKNRECHFSTRLTKDEIRSQVAVTFGERWNDDPFYAVRDSLDGKLDIAPRAVKDDIIDQLRRGERREDRIKLHLILPDDEDGPGRINIEAEEGRPDDAEDARGAIRIWASGNEAKKRFAQMREEGRTLTEIAKELGIHKNTATNWKKELSATLREMLST